MISVANNNTGTTSRKSRYHVVPWSLYEEEFEDIKETTIIRKSKDRQLNGKKKEDK